MRDKCAWKQERDSLLFFPMRYLRPSRFRAPSLVFSLPPPPFPPPPNMSELGLITGKNSRGVKDCPGEGLPLY